MDALGFRCVNLSRQQDGKHTSMLFPVDIGPGINIYIIQNGCFKQNKGGKLHGISITGHVVYVTFRRPSLTLCGSNAKSSNFSSTCFHAIEFAGCHIFPSLTSPSLCQRIYSDVFALMYNLCKRGVTGKYLKIFCGTRLFTAAAS